MTRLIKFPRTFRKAMKTVSPLAKEELLNRAVNLMGALSYAVKDENQLEISNTVSNIIHFYVTNARAVHAMGLKNPLLPQESPQVFSSNADEVAITNSETANV